MGAKTDKIEELEGRIQKLEDRVLNVAPVPESKPEPPETTRVFCLGAKRIDKEFGKYVLKTAVVRKGGEVKIAEPPDVLTSDDVVAENGKLIVWGGKNNDVTHEDPAALRLLFDHDAAFKTQTQKGGVTVRDAHIRTIEELEQALAIATATT